jgi:predicted metal-dependent hydrolase
MPYPQKFYAQFYKGIEQFNRQEFFEAHETLESVWKEHALPDRIFIQGIIQIAVGCHHLRNGNLQGATSLFKRGLSKIEPFKPSYEGVDVEKLFSSILQLHAWANESSHDSEVIIWPNI